MVIPRESIQEDKKSASRKLRSLHPDALSIRASILNENNNSRIKECLNNENEITSTKQQAENRNGIKEA